MHDSIYRDMIHNAVEEGVLGRRDIMLFQFYTIYSERIVKKKGKKSRLEVCSLD